MKEYIDILIASDVNYAPYYGVMLTSMFENNKSHTFAIYMLTDETWTEDLNNQFVNLAKKYQSQFTAIICDSAIVKNLPLATHITSPAYYHLQAANLLPQSVHNVLYLDGDMLVNGDLSELWNTDLTDKSYAGVEDCCHYDGELYQHLCYDATKGYVNNGVMLYNFDYLREIDYPKKSIEYVNQYPERIKWMDQDLDNILLLDGKVVMPLQYNFQTLFLLDYHWKNYSQEFRNRVLEASKYPIVIHYCGRIKPWHFKYWHHPYAQLWHKYRKMSPWKDAVVRKPIGKYVKFEALKILKRKQLLNKVHQEYIPQAWNLYAY